MNTLNRLGTKKNKLRICLAAMALIGLFALSASAAGRPEDIFNLSLDGTQWLTPSGDEAQGSYGSSGEMHWYAVNPDNDPAAKGLERGLLFYDRQAKEYFFQPTAEEQSYVVNVLFSPQSDRFVVCCKEGRFITKIWVYRRGLLEPEKVFLGYTDLFFFDDVRFAFTLIDQAVERPEEAGLWGTSAAVYDPATDLGYVIVKQATATESFAVLGADGQWGIIEAIKTSVESEKDWNDVDKQKDEEITIEIPAAG